MWYIIILITLKQKMCSNHENSFFKIDQTKKLTVKSNSKYRIGTDFQMSLNTTHCGILLFQLPIFKNKLCSAHENTTLI